MLIQSESEIDMLEGRFSFWCGLSPSTCEKAYLTFRLPTRPRALNKAGPLGLMQMLPRCSSRQSLALQPGSGKVPRKRSKYEFGFTESYLRHIVTA